MVRVVVRYVYVLERELDMVEMSVQVSGAEHRDRMDRDGKMW